MLFFILQNYRLQVITPDGYRLHIAAGHNMTNFTIPLTRVPVHHLLQQEDLLEHHSAKKVTTVSSLCLRWSSEP